MSLNEQLDALIASQELRQQELYADIMKFPPVRLLNSNQINELAILCGRHKENRRLTNLLRGLKENQSCQTTR